MLVSGDDAGTLILEDMPTYTYRCQKCGDEVEAVQAMTDPPLKRCRTCRGKLVRTFHPVGIVLKGSGFYKTDSRSSKRPSDERKDGSSEKKDTSKDAGSSKDAAGSGDKAGNTSGKASKD